MPTALTWTAWPMPCDPRVSRPPCPDGARGSYPQPNPCTGRHTVAEPNNVPQPPTPPPAPEALAAPEQEGLVLTPAQRVALAHALLALASDVTGLSVAISSLARVLLASEQAERPAPP